MRIKATFLNILKSKAPLALVGGAFLISSTTLATPEWINRTKTKINDKDAILNCSGSGPSFDLARREAIYNCNSALNQYLGKNAKVYSVTIQTTKDTEYHEEISSDEKYKDLSCEPLREFTEQKDSTHRVWLRCKFNLQKIEVTKKKEDLNKDNRSILKTLKAHTIKDRPELVDQTIGVYSISVVPQCENMMIKGNLPRIINCEANPVAVTIYKGDSEIIVNKEGYLSEEIIVSSEKIEDESITVLLEKILRGGI